jgi:hypothetical protein
MCHLYRGHRCDDADYRVSKQPQKQCPQPEPAHPRLVRRFCGAQRTSSIQVHKRAKAPGGQLGRVVEPKRNFGETVGFSSPTWVSRCVITPAEIPHCG